MAVKNNIDALNMALVQLMEKNKNIVVYGEDCGGEGGVFRATAGLQEKFGKERVFDSTIGEAAIAGSALGAALGGLLPIVEIQFEGFSFSATPQIFTQIARYRNRSRGMHPCPLVIRMPMGGGIKALEHHSEAIEAIYAQIPGIKVVYPSNPYDTKGLMIAAARSKDPVIFFEAKKIYRAFTQEIPDEMYEVEIGKANVLKPGKDVTVVSYGSLVHDTLKGVVDYEKANPGKTVEVIDLRTISPLDTDTIIASVKKTGRLLVVVEAAKSFSVAAEVMARVNEKAFVYLQAPMTRLTGWDITVPLARGEAWHMVTAARVTDKLATLLSFKP